MTSREARTKLIETLRLDLIGPDNDHECASELLPESPTKWYLTGYLMPTNAPEEHRFDSESLEEIGATTPARDPGVGEEDSQPTDTASAKSYLPSSVGISVLIPAGMQEFKATARWGDYRWESDEEEIPDEPIGDPEHGYAPAEGKVVVKGYRRESREESLSISLAELKDGVPFPKLIPNTGGLSFVFIKRSIQRCDVLGLPAGTCTLSAFLANYREAHPKKNTSSVLSKRSWNSPRPFHS